MKRIGQLVFLVAALLALSLYRLTVPDGLPWNDSVSLALAYLGEVVRPESVPHPVWGFHVQVFGGAVALSCVLSAVAAGLLATVVNRYLGWRIALSASLAWMSFPWVWNGAVTGQRGVCLASTAVFALWLGNAVLLRVLRRARARREAEEARVISPAPATGRSESAKRDRINRIAAWSVSGAAVVFVLASLTFHDYDLGEPASVFARGVAEAAGSRVIVMNGACDAQLVRERGSAAVRAPGLSLVALRNDDAYRADLLARVKESFPDETNLWVMAQVGPAAFAEAACRRFPERFYLMDGSTSTPDRWNRRWNDFKPFLESSDPFVPVARRLFAVEGNALANRMLDEGLLLSPANSNAHSAFLFYRQIYSEVDPGNFSALVNMSEMVRLGLVTDGDERKRIQDRMETFLRNPANRKAMLSIARASGPVRADPVRLERMVEESRNRLAARVASGEKVEFAPEVLSLVEWNNAMLRLMDGGEYDKAGRIARAILSNPKWREFIPANVVLGTVSAREGDYIAGEAFFRAAVTTTNRTEAVVLNDYADTLMRLGLLDEAERMARRAVAESDETFWFARFTLAEILGRKMDAPGSVGSFTLENECRDLLKRLSKSVPDRFRDRFRELQRSLAR